MKIGKLYYLADTDFRAWPIFCFCAHKLSQITNFDKFWGHWLWRMTNFKKFCGHKFSRKGFKNRETAKVPSFKGSRLNELLRLYIFLGRPPVISEQPLRLKLVGIFQASVSKYHLSRRKFARFSVAQSKNLCLDFRPPKVKTFARLALFVLLSH